MVHKVAQLSVAALTALNLHSFLFSPSQAAKRSVITIQPIIGDNLTCTYFLECTKALRCLAVRMVGEGGGGGRGRGSGLEHKAKDSR